jgi:hypothetical protein
MRYRKWSMGYDAPENGVKLHRYFSLLFARKWSMEYDAPENSEEFVKLHRKFSLFIARNLVFDSSFPCKSDSFIQAQARSRRKRFVTHQILDRIF